MSEAKDAFMFALDECLNRLDAVVGPEINPEAQPQKVVKQLEDPNFMARTRVRDGVEALRARLSQLEKGVWPPFREDDAEHTMQLIERLRLDVQANTTDTVFQKAVLETLTPLRETVERYAVAGGGVWKFRAVDVDPIPAWDPPPARGS